MCDPVSVGLGTAAAGGAKAIGDFQSGRAQTDAVNEARRRQYRDQLALNQFKYIKDVGVFNQARADLDAGLLESERALSKGLTAIQKQAAERAGASAFASQDRLAKSINASGSIASLPAGGSRDRIAAITKASFGRETALDMDNLLRGRFSDISTAQGLTDKANSFRRQLFGRMPAAPSMAPTPSAPVMQAGPSPFSLIAGLGGAALSGVSAGYGMAADLKTIG